MDWNMFAKTMRWIWIYTAFRKENLLVLSREWMGQGLGVAGMIIASDYGSFPHSLLSTSK
jgi:hypothetical protein